jgi:hypothetical protein
MMCGVGGLPEWPICAQQQEETQDKGNLTELSFEDIVSRLLTEEGKKHAKENAVKQGITLSPETVTETLDALIKDADFTSDRYSKEQRFRDAAKVAENYGRLKEAITLYKKGDDLVGRARVYQKLGKERFARWFFNREISRLKKEGYYDSAAEIAEKNLSDAELAQKLRKEGLKRDLTKYIARTREEFAKSIRERRDTDFRSYFNYAIEKAEQLGDEKSKRELLDMAVEYELNSPRCDGYRLREAVDYARKTGDNSFISGVMHKCFERFKTIEPPSFPREYMEVAEVICQTQEEYGLIIDRLLEKFPDGFFDSFAEAGRIAEKGGLAERARELYQKQMLRCERGGYFADASKYASKAGDDSLARLYAQLAAKLGEK